MSEKAYYYIREYNEAMCDAIREGECGNRRAADFLFEYAQEIAAKALKECNIELREEW